MICPNCQKENADNFRYCQFCGAPISSSLVMKLQELGTDVLPSSTVSTPGNLDAWLSDNIETANLEPQESGVPLSELSLTGVAEHKFVPMDKGRKRISTEDLPLLDESNATFIPVEFIEKSHEIELEKEEPPHPRSLSKRFCAQCGAIILDGHRFCGTCGAKYSDDEDGASLRSPSREMLDNVSPRRSVERLSFVKARTQENTSQAETTTAWEMYHINDDGTLGERIQLNEGDNLIGRSSSRLLSTDRFVNPNHMRIKCEGNELTVEDNNSLNGVFFRLSDASTTLMSGDIFRIGEELLCLVMGDSSQPLLSNKTAESTELLGCDEIEGWGYLSVIMGAYSEGSVYRLYQPSVSLGRTHANILFPKDGFVSGTHASIQPAGDHAVLTDLNSSNGTFVRLKGPMTIHSAAYFLIGNQLLLIQPA